MIFYALKTMHLSCCNEREIIEVFLEKSYENIGKVNIAIILFWKEIDRIARA